MLNRKLLEILRHLTASDKKRLRQFLLSPYFNSNAHADKVVQLYDLILRYDAREEHPALAKAKVFRIFFPDGQFRENTKTALDSLTTQLFLLIRRFLSQTELERESGELREHLALAQFYRKFAFEDRFRQTMQTLRTLQQDSAERDARYFFEQFLIEEEELKFRSMYNAFEDELNLNAVHENLDQYYSILKLDFTTYLEYQKRFAPVRQLPSNLLMECVVQLSAEGRALDSPVNRIYLLLLQLLREQENPDTFDTWERLLAEHEPLISEERYKSLMTLYRILWHQKYSKSGDAFSRSQIFRINREHLEKGYFYFDGLIPFSAFRNLVMFALKSGEIDWVRHFLETHPPERIGGTRYPAEIHSLNLAEYYFFLKQYDEAQENLVYRPFENAMVGIAADLLLVKIYYEIRSNLLESRMLALDQKVRRCKLSREVKNRYYNFLKKLDKIVKYGWQKKNPKRERLVQEIQTSPDIVAREWLLEKLNEL